jgi:hypothetical protein
LVFPEETHFFQQIVGNPDRHNPDYLLSHTSLKLFQRGEIQMTSGFRDYSQVDPDLFETNFRELWKSKFTTLPSILEIFMQSYGQATGQMDARYWVEKTPLNEKHLKKAQTWWPDLKAIFMLRDPRDNYCSYQKQRARRYENRRKRILADGNLSPRAARQRIASLSPPLAMNAFIAYWLESINHWERFATQNPNCMLIQYEKLVQSPKDEMTRIVEFLDIEWDDILLAPTRNGSPWSGNSVFNTEFTGISTSSLGRYREILSVDEIRFLESWLKPVIDSYGWQIGDNMIALGVLLLGLLTSESTKPSQKLKLVIELFRCRFSLGRNSRNK